MSAARQSRNVFLCLLSPPSAIPSHYYVFEIKNGLSNYNILLFGKWIAIYLIANKLLFTWCVFPNTADILLSQPSPNPNPGRWLEKLQIRNEWELSLGRYLHLYTNWAPSVHMHLWPMPHSLVIHHLIPPLTHHPSAHTHTRTRTRTQIRDLSRQ